MLEKVFFKTGGLLFLAVSLISAFAAAETAQSEDEIVLLNGSRLLGDVGSIRNGILTLETEFAGTLSIKLDRVESMTVGKPNTIQTAEGETLRNIRVTVRDRKLVLPEEIAASESRYALSDIKLLNPDPWELGEGYRWTGKSSLALSAQRGNSETSEVDYDIDSTWRSTKDRYKLRLFGELDETDGEKNADNWTLTGKYDRFLEGPWYWGMNASVEQDKFADLDYRYYIGPYAGREFFTDPLFSLSGEVGLSYVKEDFIEADDQDYPGMTWNLNATSDYLGGGSNIYFEQIGIWNLNATSDLFVNTRFGVSFPLLMNIEAAAEIYLEYDAGAVNNVDELDQTYNFRLGYTW